VAIVGNSKNPGNALAVKEVQGAAEGSKMTLHSLDVVDPKDIEPAFRAASKEGAGAILVLGSPVLNAQRKQVGEVAIKYRLPAIYYTADWAQDGGLMSYGVNRNDLARRAATYVDKILKGTKPGDLPVEQPTKFELIINLKTAKQIGLTIPPNVLVRADRVIK
jgi:putative ABC transport system substrate-binding protein